MQATKISAKDLMAKFLKEFDISESHKTNLL
jgi:hypothetical protein